MQNGGAPQTCPLLTEAASSSNGGAARRPFPRQDCDGLEVASPKNGAHDRVITETRKCRADRMRIRRRDEDRGAVQRLAVRRQVAEDKRRTTCGGLHRGQPESLGQRGEDDRPRARVQARERLVGNEAGQQGHARPGRARRPRPDLGCRREVRIALEIACEHERRRGVQLRVAREQRLEVLVGLIPPAKMKNEPARSPSGAS